MILGIETATPVCSVGLANGQCPGEEIHVIGKSIHAEKLPLLVDQLFKKAGIEFQHLQGIAVSIGPGSFTGLRVGLGFAKGMALGLGIPLIPVLTHDALVRGVPLVKEYAVVLVPSRKNEVYGRLYRQNGNFWDPQEPVGVYRIDRFKEELPSRDVVFAGPGAEMYRDQIGALYHGTLEIKASQPSGLHVAYEGIRRMEKGEACAPDEVIPFYCASFQGVD